MRFIPAVHEVEALATKCTGEVYATPATGLEIVISVADSRSGNKTNIGTRQRRRIVALGRAASPFCRLERNMPRQTEPLELEPMSLVRIQKRRNRLEQHFSQPSPGGYCGFPCECGES